MHRIPDTRFRIPDPPIFHLASGIWYLVSGIWHLASAFAWHNLPMSGRDEILELFQRAAADREHGAVEIERTLIRGLLDIETRLRVESLHRGLKMLAEGQPAMANLRSMAAWMAAIESPASCVSRLARRAAVLDELPERLAVNAWQHIKNSATVVTLSRSSAVAATLEGAWERGWDGSAVVLDGMASACGADQARRLEASGRAISRPDSDALVWLNGAAVVVLVGADAVGGRRLVNAAGTRKLLELSRLLEVETVLVADTGKNVGEEIVDEIVRRLPFDRESRDREWPIFEVVPLELVTARVTE